MFEGRLCEESALFSCPYPSMGTEWLFFIIIQRPDLIFQRPVLIFQRPNPYFLHLNPIFPPLDLRS